MGVLQLTCVWATHTCGQLGCGSCPTEAPHVTLAPLTPNYSPTRCLPHWHSWRAGCPNQRPASWDAWRHISLGPRPQISGVNYSSNAWGGIVFMFAWMNREPQLPRPLTALRLLTASGLEVKHSPNVQTIYIPGLISCAGVTGSVGITRHARATQMAGLSSPQSHSLVAHSYIYYCTCTCIYQSQW